jgi:hypothetical protein
MLSCAARHAVDRGGDYGRDDPLDCLSDASLALKALAFGPLVERPWTLK